MWIAFAGTEPLQDSIHEDDPGMCMLYLMEHYPQEVGRDFIDWVDMRDSRAETAVRALFDSAIASALKEGYLDFVSVCAMVTGYYSLGNGLSIRNIEDTEGDE